jgi:hypothetical protein
MWCLEVQETSHILEITYDRVKIYWSQFAPKNTLVRAYAIQFIFKSLPCM